MMRARLVRLAVLLLLRAADMRTQRILNSYYFLCNENKNANSKYILNFTMSVQKCLHITKGKNEAKRSQHRALIVQIEFVLRALVTTNIMSRWNVLGYFSHIF